jgi:hypothetical protein
METKTYAVLPAAGCMYGSTKSNPSAAEPPVSSATAGDAVYYLGRRRESTSRNSLKPHGASNPQQIDCGLFGRFARPEDGAVTTRMAPASIS